MISAAPLLSFRLREKMPMSPADPSTPRTCRGDTDSDQLTSILMGNNPVNQLTRYPYMNPKFFANNPIGRRDLVRPYGSKTNHPTTFSSKEVKGRCLLLRNCEQISPTSCRIGGVKRNLLGLVVAPSGASQIRYERFELGAIEKKRL